MNYIIREMDSQDIPEVSKLILSVARKFNYNEYSYEGKSTFEAAHSPEGIHRLVKFCIKFFVLEKEGEILGVISIKEKKHLFQLYVKSTAHRKGYGARLWNYSVQKLQMSGKVTVNASKYAVPFYKRLGFEPTGEVDYRGGFTSYRMITTLMADNPSIS
ncbi:GNAT family N-acetyltransferase [Limibacter armeniacum]|uniref:GNAT family N-acetyltransferase n=1 Tax=Limibacter armeniacum TaxID=466084 RepID=UPI002FE63AFB